LHLLTKSHIGYINIHKALNQNHMIMTANTAATRPVNATTAMHDHNGVHINTVSICRTTAKNNHDILYF